MKTWQRNLYAIWIAEFFVILGWSVIQPFIPYFIQDLGVTDVDEVKLYSGLAISVQAVMMTIFSPIWGSLADRYGRKIMVERSMFSGAVVWFLIAHVQDVPTLLLLRALQGALTGTIGAATTLVASSTPRERTGSALGGLQMAVYLGGAMGPVVGGLAADAWGYRAACQVTSALMGFAGLVVHLMVQENFTPVATKRGEGGFWHGVRLALTSPVLLPVLLMRLLQRLGERVQMPILPLFVQSLLPAGARVASANGLVQGAAGAASALGAVILGRAGDRVGYRRVLLACSIGAAIFFVPQFFVQAIPVLIVLQAITGFMVGGTLTSLSAMLAHLVPEGRQGAVYGLDSSAVGIGNTLGPMLGAGIAVGLGLRPSFLFIALVFAASALLIARVVPQKKAG